MSELGKVDSYDELRPANIYDVAANETWLEDQSAQGWHLTGFSGWSGLFARGEPKHCRYRMQPLPKKEKAPDPAQLGQPLGRERDVPLTLIALLGVVLGQAVAQ